MGGLQLRNEASHFAENVLSKAERGCLQLLCKASNYVMKSCMMSEKSDGTLAKDIDPC